MKTEINIYSPIFAEFLENINKAIINCLAEVYEGNFSGGDISAKISLELISGSEPYLELVDGEEKKRYYSYKHPSIEHKVALTLKKKAEAKGGYIEPDQELIFDGERFTLAKVKRAQMTIDEMGADNEND